VRWRKPLDWTRGAGRPRAERPRAVDVIIPIYGAAEALARCLDSVAAETDLARHRVILVVDGPQESAVESLVSAFAAARVLRNDERLGFAASVNRGMSESTSDVVLLNSDTVVTAGWLEKLIDAAYANGDTGTVTPLSNHATLCSVPRAFEENLIPSGFDIASFARLVESVSSRRYPLLPTGVGFCLYIRRALLDDIGLFDAQRFGRGYGEENDFCMRALARGWLHVADDATFVYHAGHRSFGASRASRQRRARAALSRIHRQYMATIAEFMRRDPLAPVRASIDAGIGTPPSRRLARRRPGAARERDAPGPAGGDAGVPMRIVHLVHGWPPFQHAGTELYAYWLVSRQREAHHVAVYARSADPARGEGEAVEMMDGGARVRLMTNHFTARNPLSRNAISDRHIERDFERFLRSESPDLLHVHHLAGHAFSLVRVAQRLGIPIVMQIQDWWFLCARVNLFHRDGYRCSGPAPEKCAHCATLTKVPPASITNRIVHAMRRRAARSALAACDAFVAGSKSIRDDYAGIVPPSTPFHVIPYGVAIASCGTGSQTDLSKLDPTNGDETLEQAPQTPHPAFGHPLPASGARGSRKTHGECPSPRSAGRRCREAADEGLPLSLSANLDSSGSQPVQRPIRFGYVGSNAPHKGVHVAVEAMRGIDPADAVLQVWDQGQFPEEDKPRVFAAMDVLLVPSIGLESFGLAAREAMACGVPVIASAGGALSEMFEPGVCGEFFPPGDAAALRAIIQRVIDEPAIVDRWRARLPQPKSADVHAEEIERVYRSVLER
jgi:GT2 family glycosyltransferase/glycosyltransferase involved in cell wall biosynthesis